MKKILLILLFIFSFLNADITQYFPKLEGRVVDEANLLSPLVKKDIDLILISKHIHKISHKLSKLFIQ